MYVESLPLGTQGLITETTDSGLETEGAPSEFSVDMSGQYRKAGYLSLLHIFFRMFVFCSCSDESKVKRYQYP